jgi:hypothetical protein
MDFLSKHDNEVQEPEGAERSEGSGSFTSESIDKQAPLCSECKAIFDNWHERDNWSSARPRHSHHHIVGLQSSARQGCPVCAMLLNGLSPSTTKTLLEDWNRSQSQSLVSVEKIVVKQGYYISLNFPLADDEGTKVEVHTSGE